MSACLPGRPLHHVCPTHRCWENLSGAFKGPSTIEDDLAGQGRFVIAATSAYEEAQDAGEGGTPSPFTAALVAALKGAAVRTDNHVTLEDLSTYLEGPIPELKSRPRKNFDGTGSVVIARIPNLHDAEALERRQDQSAELQSTAAPVKASEGLAHESPAWWRSGNLPSGRRLRARNDYSLGDLTSYRFYGILAVATIAFGIVSAARMNSEFTASEGVIGFNGIAPSCVAAVITGAVMLMIVFADWVLTRRIIRNASSRRSLLAGYSMGPVRFVRLMRDGCAICAAAIVAYGVTRDYGDALYVILLALLAVPILASAAGRLHFGDAAYAAGTVLVLSSLFFPITTEGYNMLLGDNGIGLIQLACGILMAYFWVARFSAGALLLASLACVIPAAPELADTVGIPIAPLIAVVGSSISLMAVILGDGTLLEADGSLPPSRMLLRRPGIDRLKHFDEDNIANAEGYENPVIIDR